MNTYIAINKMGQQLQRWDEKVETPWHIIVTAKK